MPLTPLTPDFVQEARSLVKSGGFLEMGIREVCMKSNGSEVMHEIQWKRVFVHVIPEGGCLVIDKKPTSYGSSRIVFATLPPDAGVANNESAKQTLICALGFGEEAQYRLNISDTCQNLLQVPRLQPVGPI
jgi:hypothetical protein